MTTQEMVILVDDADHELGLMEKMEAHQKGLLHRAISIFVFNHKNELMIHKRAATKYHSSGLWTNTCCSHPRENESLLDAAHRRLKEEMGFDCTLEYSFKFTYRAHLDQGLIEHELDHVFIGKTNEIPQLNPEEASDWKYMSLALLNIDIKANPDNYTAWFKIALPLLQQQSHFQNTYL
jgi:isopentenyl-diphosphate delta-isomerase